MTGAGNFPAAEGAVVAAAELCLLAENVNSELPAVVVGAAAGGFPAEFLPKLKSAGAVLAAGC